VPDRAVHEHGQRFDRWEVVSRASEIEGADRPEAAYHAQVIVDLVGSRVPPSDLQQLCGQLPESEDDGNWREPCEVIDAGGWTEAQEAQTADGPQSEGDGE
jgi:hypothetical protein